MTRLFFVTIMDFVAISMFFSHLATADGARGPSIVRLACESNTLPETFHTNGFKRPAVTIVFEQQFHNESNCQIINKFPTVKEEDRKHSCSGDLIHNILTDNKEFSTYSTNDVTLEDDGIVNGMTFKMIMHYDTDLVLSEKSPDEQLEIVNKIVAKSGQKPYDKNTSEGFIEGKLRIESGNIIRFDESYGFSIYGSYNPHLSETIRLNLATNRRDGVNYAIEVEKFTCQPPQLIPVGTPEDPEADGGGFESTTSSSLY